MVDTRKINLLSLIQQDTHLEKVANTDGGEYAGPCPFCGGTDRFHVWSNRDKPRFWCRQCKISGDAINYIQKRDNLSFKDACETLDLDLPQNNASKHRRQPLSKPINTLKDDYPALTDEQWQQHARTFVKLAYGTLHDPIGKPSRLYLIERGINLNSMHKAQLGYNPGDKRMQWGNTEVWLPEGIIIPWWIDDKIWRINIRRTEGTPKYINIKGAANGLYRADTIGYKKPVIMVEGEFDALVLAEHLDNQFSVVATGSMSGSRLLRWLVEIKLADTILLAFDADEAGEKASNWWQEKLGQQAHRLKPLAHDITDMLQQNIDLKEWVSSIS